VHQVFLKQGVALAVDFLVHLQDAARGIEVQRHETGVNQLEHVVQSDGHFRERFGVGGGKLAGSGLDAMGDAHGEIADPLQIGDALEAGKQLTGAGFADARNGGGQAFVDLALNHVQFLFTFLNGEKGHAGGVSEQIAEIERGVAGNQARLQRQLREMFDASRAGTIWSVGRLGFGWDSRFGAALPVGLSDGSSLCHQKSLDQAL
jgi:hypothetical protein